MNTFKRLVDAEMTSVRARGHSCKSWHEGYGLILEEMDEFWDEVKRRPSKRDRLNALRELVQIGTLAERIAIDLALVDDYEKHVGKGFPDPFQTKNGAKEAVKVDAERVLVDATA